MVEYGGKDHICPWRRVEISRGRSERELYEWGMVSHLYSYFETLINDMTFDGYQVRVGSPAMLPGFEETEETKTPAHPTKPH